jgi:hypothetical protein
MKLKMIKWVMACAVTICAIGLLVYGLKHKAAVDAQRAEEATLTKDVVREGLWDADDYRHLTEIGDKSDTVSDADFRWLMAQFTSKAPPPMGDRAAVVSLVQDELLDAHLTRSQIVEVSNAAMARLYDEDPHDAVSGSGGLIQEEAIELLEKYHNKAAVPRLRVLLNSPHIWVRYHAAIALNAVGDRVTVPPRPTKW